MRTGFSSEVPWEERKQLYDAAFFDKDNWWWSNIQFWSARAKAVCSATNPKTVLDCGCAKGSLVKFLVDLGVNSFGFDLSEYAINTTPYPEIRERLFCLDLALEELPFTALSVDVTCCFDFLEHQDDRHIEIVVSRIKEVTQRIVLIVQPFYPIRGFDVQSEVHRATDGLPLFERWAVLRGMGIHEVQPNPANGPHPNERPRRNVLELFRPEFTEMELESPLYDFCESADGLHMLPFYDTLVLLRV